METPLGLTTLQTSRVMWKSSRVCGVRLKVFRTPGKVASGRWIGFDVGVSIFIFVHVHGYLIAHCFRELMIPIVTGRVS